MTTPLEWKQLPRSRRASIGTLSADLWKTMDKAWDPWIVDPRPTVQRCEAGKLFAVWRWTVVDEENGHYLATGQELTEEAAMQAAETELRQQAHKRQ